MPWRASVCLVLICCSHRLPRMSLLFESLVTDILVGIVTLTAVFLYWSQSTYDYWKKKGVRFLKPIPFFGNTLPLITATKSNAELFKEFYNHEEFKNEKFGGVYLSRKPVLLARDPDFIKQILIKDFQYFSERGLTFDEKLDPLSAHLFNLGGWRWRALRTKLTPTFTSGKMKMMYGVMDECSDGLEKMLDDSASKGEEIEIKEPLAKFTTDIIGTCAFGLQMNAMTNPDSEFRKMGQSIFSTSFIKNIKRLLITSFPKMTSLLKFRFLPVETTNFFINTTKEMVEYREKNSVRRNDFMQLLIDVKNKGAVHDDEGKYETTQVKNDESGKQVLELTDSLLAAQAFIFFLAGFETSSTTMSFALYELARNPEVQEKLAKEVREAAAKEGGRFSYDTLQELKYLDMVIAEALRKYPPVPNLFRNCTKEFKIEGTDIVLEKGCRVFIPIYAIQRDPKYYPNPERFDPERFTAEEKANRHPALYMPFGDGPKNCIGARFGLLQSKIGLATLIKNYSFEVCDKTPGPKDFDNRAFVTTLKGGVWLRIKKRSN